MTKTPTSRTSLKKQSEQQSSAERISSAVEYYRLELAAKNLGCSAEELLHLGVIGKAQIMAPVLMSGEYEWRGLEAGAFPELKEPIRRDFGTSDRVILLSEDLAQIEAIGWATPTQFSYPSRARDAVKFERAFLGYGFEQESVEIHQYELNQMVNERVMQILSASQGQNVSGGVSLKGKSESVDETCSLSGKGGVNDADTYNKFLLQQRAYFLPWRAIESEDAQIKTEINHLFISRHEIDRIKAGKPLDEISQVISDGEVGSGSHWGPKREVLLMAAIYCKATWPKDCEDVSYWIARTQLVLQEVWPHMKKPAFSESYISRKLNEAINLEKIKASRSTKA